MIPVIAIVGRPNVGKSTLFNCFTRSQDALVADFPGVTRDRQYGRGALDDRSFLVIDTGGFTNIDQHLHQQINQQAKQAIDEADAVIFLLDARAGLTADDRELMHELRKIHKPLFICANKIDDLDEDIALADFYQLGVDKIYSVAAVQQRGVKKLLTEILDQFDAAETFVENPGIKIAVVGRPNVGKSTLINRLLGEERVIVFDEPGTTRDSIFIPFERREQHYTLIDTAGVRRRTKVSEVIEKFSVIKTLQAIESADVVLILIDATANLAEQDLRLISFCLRAGKAMISVINKWDNLSDEQRESVHSELDRRLDFLPFVEKLYTSALHGSGVGKLYEYIHRAHAAAMAPLMTAELTDILEQALAAHQPPLVNGRRIKLRYAHAAGHQPPQIVIHGSQAEKCPQNYRRYLNSFFRKKLQLVATPIRLIFRSTANPFAGRVNQLTPRQQRHRQRLLKHKK